MEPYDCRCDILDDNGVIELGEVLKMHVHVLAWQTMELVCLQHHGDTTRYVLINDTTLSSLKIPKSSQSFFRDELVTK